MVKIEEHINKIRTAINKKKAVIGTDRTLKNLKLGKVVIVFLSRNCPESVKEDVSYYAGLSKTEIVQLPYANNELGVVCKKPFSISVLSIKR